MKRFGLLSAAIAALALTLVGSTAFAQVTTGGLTVTVTGPDGLPREGARVSARHEPSGTRYEGRTMSDGRATIPGMRVGGPYTVTAAALGLQPASEGNVEIRLGSVTTVQLTLREAAVQLGEVTVTAEQDAVFSTARTGAATAINRAQIAQMPTITGRIEDITRLTPQYAGGGFAGQDNRLNNMTVDGSYFNNSFGLGGAPGDRTQVAPISLSAIEAIQVNVAPYDVRQGHFVGGAVNTVTRSGTNEFSGSAHWSFRDQRPSLHGRTARALPVNVGTFEIEKKGFNLGGPILRNRLFFFVDYAQDDLTEPGTTFRANRGGETVGGGVTRVTQGSLDSLSNFLRSNFGYDPGPYQGYDHSTPATRLLWKLDYNVNDRNKLTLRYNRLDSFTDILLSQSSSLGFGTRRSNTTGLNFQNSNYQILENIRSVVGEWNSLLGSNWSNNLLIGHSEHDESRASRGDMFPFVDILSGSTVYTSFGFEPFTPNNELRYKSRQLQNNITRHGIRHDLTFGLSGEWYESENVFFPGSQSVYVYNSLADFYTDANAFIAQCGTNQATWATCSRTTPGPVPVNRFQVRWINQPGMEKPIQPLKVFYAGAYVQDQWQVASNLRLTVGLRADRSSFENTAFTNDSADKLVFRDEAGNAVQYRTGKLPDPKILWSPRVGFNWDVQGNRSTQVRGGSGLFSGPPLYVWISNQIGNTGVLTGFDRQDNTTARPFHPLPSAHKPAASSITGAPAASYELALTDENFKFPQVWRTNIAADQRLPWGFIGTGEFIYNRDVNGIYYINANLPEANSQFVGADDRPRWVTSAQRPSCSNPTPGPCVTRLNNSAGNRVENAIVLKNQNIGRSWNIAGTLERPFAGGSFVKAFYSYGESKNTIDPGSIAFGSWNNNQHAGDPNNPGLGFSVASPGHRIVAVGSMRRNWIRWGATTMMLTWEGRTIGNLSYTHAFDLNGDGGTSNDLLYVPRDISEMNFQTYCLNTGREGACAVAGQTTITSQAQAEAWEAYIQQDKYLSSRRGQYAERGGVFLPMVYRADLAFTQDIRIPGRQAFQVRLDFLNVGNKIGPNWGVGQRLVNAQPLIQAQVHSPTMTDPNRLVGIVADSEGRATYRLRRVNNEFMNKSFEQTTGLADVYRIQLSLRYMFNQ